LKPAVQVERTAVKKSFIKLPGYITKILCVQIGRGSIINL
jgi:hypothetical protein